MAQRAEKAFAAIKDAARRSGDQRLMALASAAPKSVKGAFDPIIKAIEKMVTQLQKEEDTDLDIKQTCEKDRMDDTRLAAVTSREIDDNTDLITKLTAEIAECEKQIEELQAEHKKTKEALAAAQKMRNEENAEWKQTDNDDKLAAETVKSAKDVLTKWYKENSFLQQPVTDMAAGEAPPPPPPTDFGGAKTGESQGIVAIMEMVYEDIVKDRNDAKADEDASQKEFDNFKKDSEDNMKALKKEEQATDKRMGAAETNKVQTEKQRTTAKGKLDGVLSKISDINPNCEYYMVNYPMRTKNRQIEIDGLNKAKAILEGGTFNAGPDPNREIKPGDAFLQKRA
jgi:chromosome segregation ATPase